MGLIFMESFDGYGGTAAHATKWHTVGTLAASPVRTGSYAGQGTWRRHITLGSTTIIVGFAVYWNGSATLSCATYQAAGFAGDDVQWEIDSPGDGKLRLFRGGSVLGTNIATTAAPVLVASSWNFIEAKIVVDNAGSYMIKCNGVEVLSGSADTQGEATAAMAGIAWTLALGGLDDLYVLDSTGSYNNDLIGDGRVECLTAQAGNGANTGLTCSTGTDHGALVDESPANDDTDYTYSATAGVKDTYTFTNLTVAGGTATIKAVQTTVRARKTDVATKELAIVVRQGGTDYDGTTQAVAATTYGQYSHVWDRRPSDTGAWTVSDLDGAEFGMKVVS